MDSRQTTFGPTKPHRPRPLLFERREYVVEMEGTTTACVSSTTSPVKEYTPDD